VRERQDMSFLERRFSRDAQLWWRDAKAGDTLVLAVPVKEPGRYKVSLALCCADDYGIAQFTLAGKALGAPFDGYAQHVQTTGAFEFGTVDLGAGDAELRCELVGKNEKAKPRFMVGIDYLRLEKLP
jgi:hypothetical protein